LYAGNKKVFLATSQNMVKKNEANEIIEGVVEKIESSVSSPIIKKIHFEFEEEERKKNMQIRTLT